MAPVRLAEYSSLGHQSPPLLFRRKVRVIRAKPEEFHHRGVLIEDPPQLGDRFGMEIHPEVHQGKRLPVHHQQGRRPLPADLSPGCLSRLQRPEQPLRQGKLAAVLEGLGHSRHDPLAHEEVPATGDIGAREVPGPGPIRRSGVGRGPAVPVHHQDLPFLRVGLGRQDVRHHGVGGPALPQTLQPSSTQSRVGDRL